jgi:hypothetical protein
MIYFVNFFEILQFFLCKSIAIVIFQGWKDKEKFKMKMRSDSGIFSHNIDKLQSEKYRVHLPIWKKSHVVGISPANNNSMNSETCDSRIQ